LLPKGGRGIVIRGNAEKLIEDVNDWTFPMWSPDGKYIGFARARSEQDRGSYVFRLLDKREFKVIEITPKEVGTGLSMWSKDSKKTLFFRSGYEYQSSLRLVSAYGGPWVELGKGLKLSLLRWSPDGKTIVTLGWGADFGCWIIPVAGGAPIRIKIETKPKVMGFPDYPISPDLKKLAFIGEDSSLWVVSISPEEMKTTGPAIKIADQLKRTTGTQPSYFFASCSPDGKKIAFASTKSGNVDIWAASADGKELIQLTNDLEDETKGGYRSPVWSPDGKMLAYISKDGIWLVPASGGKAQQVAKEASDPSWSPDGKELGFIKGSHISVITLETGTIRNIVDLKAHGLDPKESGELSWSPDGKKLAFVSYKSPGNRIFVIPIEGGELLELVKDDPGDKYYLSWSPDGKKLSYNSDRYVRVRTGAIWEADIEELLSKME
jgi:TolB protein